jgi:hypothetical protein
MRVRRSKKRIPKLTPETAAGIDRNLDAIGRYLDRLRYETTPCQTIGRSLGTLPGATSCDFSGRICRFTMFARVQILPPLNPRYLFSSRFSQ